MGMKRVSSAALEFDKSLCNAFGGGDSASYCRLLRCALLYTIRNGLTERQRQMLELYYFGGYDMVEISRLLNVNKSTVSRTISRARQIITERLRFLNKRGITGDDEYPDI